MRWGEVGYGECTEGIEAAQCVAEVCRDVLTSAVCLSTDWVGRDVRRVADRIASLHGEMLGSLRKTVCDAHGRLFDERQATVDGGEGESSGPKPCKRFGVAESPLWPL